MDRIYFKINDDEYSVGSEVSSDWTLLDYIRHDLGLFGTKYMCRQGVCGACVVSVDRPEQQTIAVNSCLVSTTSCRDWTIRTIEGIGNKLAGYHPLQRALAGANGTQCGHCSPGMVMAMYSILQKKKKMTMLEIENSLASNICRCTGYRSILKAFKQFASDASNPGEILDIEDLKLCNKTGKLCDKEKCSKDDWYEVQEKDLVDDDYVIKITLSDRKKWFVVQRIVQIYDILKSDGDDSYQLVAGNTARGLYPINEFPRILIDISSVSELKTHNIDQNLEIGAGLTITELMELFEIIKTTDYFGYLQKFVDHLQEVAHIIVRNLGTIGGNLMLKHQHQNFPSDLYLLFSSVGGMLTILTLPNSKETITMEQFLKMDMKNKIIYNVLLPPLTNDYHFVRYKVIRRAQNALASVNSGFLYKLSDNGVVLEARLTYGGLSSSFTYATKTAALLIGKQLFNNETIQSAIAVLNKELVIEPDPPRPSAKYRKKLAISLFYKSILSLCPPNIVNAKYVSGATVLKDMRPVSQASQQYDTDPSLWPLNQPMPKLEALLQCSGEAAYAEDNPALPGEVFAALVLATVGVGKIDAIDPSKALSIPGVVAFYSADNIPGKNSYTIPALLTENVADMELFCSSKVKYYGQPIGVIVAKDYYVANRAAKLVEIKYIDVAKPVIDIKEAKNDPTRIIINKEIPATNTKKDVSQVVKTEVTIYGQFHYTIESLLNVSKPTEQGLVSYSPTQWTNGIHVSSASVLKIDESRIDVITRRVGGSFGLKINPSNLVGAACNLVTYLLHKPCRLIMPISAVLQAIGKRFPVYFNSEAAVDSSGVIQFVNYNIYEDNGCEIVEVVTSVGRAVFNNVYDRSRWSYKAFDIITDTANNGWFRAPGVLEAVAMAEHTMENISYQLSMDPIEVRLKNIDKEDDKIRDMVQTIKEKGDYDTRRTEVEKFNSENRWKKRGLRVAFIRYPIRYYVQFYVTLSVFQGDGSISIHHGGCEMGQGINTKAIQICSYMLKVPLEKIQVKPENSSFTINSASSRATTTTQTVIMGVRKCCEELLRRLDPIKKQLKPDASWEELILQAYVDEVDLQTHAYLTKADKKDFPIYGVTLAEVEIDVLTGEHQILRVDLIQDVGRSINPELDIGQIEGGFVMAAGYWTQEELQYADSGRILVEHALQYAVPQARDIPQDFRIYIEKNSYSFDVLFGAKGSSEPPTCMGVVLAFAIREALAAARRHSGHDTKEFFSLDGPATAEKICLLCDTKLEDMILN